MTRRGVLAQQPIMGDTYTAVSKTAPAGNRGLTSAGTSRQEALVNIPPQPYDENPHPEHGESADTATIARLQNALERSVRARADLTDRLADAMARNVDLAKLSRHWFVDDDAGFCLACGNRETTDARHVTRVGA